MREKIRITPVMIEVTAGIATSMLVKRFIDSVCEITPVITRIENRLAKIPIMVLVGSLLTFDFLRAICLIFKCEFSV
jgi:hypothetical protein